MKPFLNPLSALILLCGNLSAQQGAMPPLPNFVGGAVTAPAQPAPAPQPASVSETGILPEEPAPADAATNDESADAAPSGAPVPLATATPPPAGGAPAVGASDPSHTPDGAAGGPAPAQISYLQRSNLILAKLLDNERAVDPFGLVMDPANTVSAPSLANQYEEVDEPTVVNNSMLKDALLTLPITGVYPGREVLVLGARTFPVGGEFGMKLQDLTIRLRFEGIRGGELFFKDMETREVTSIPFNPRPAEFEPLVKGSKREPGSGILPMGDLFIAN